VGLEFGAGLTHGELHFRDLMQRVEQAVVMNHSVVTNGGDIDPGGVEFTRVSFAFVTQHISTGSLDKCWRQAAQLLDAGTQW
jgi:hypothetical protein